MAQAASMPYLPEFLYKLLRKCHLIRPSPSPLKPGDSVWLWDNTAFPTDDGQWTAEFTAAYFRAQSGKPLATAVAQIAEAIGLANADPSNEPVGYHATPAEAEPTITKRVQPFINIVLDDRLLDVDFQGETIHLGPHADGGLSVDMRTLSGDGWENGKELASRAVLPAGVVEGNCISSMKTRFAGSEGWAVVSDIDDTIKQSYVRDRIKLLRYTFVFPPTPVDGQPALYDSFTKTFSSPAFFYLSASPYSLYQMLHPFIQKYFPPGQILLRNMTWQELESFVMSLTVGTQEYKQMQLDKLMGWFPKRKWVFIGDSTQTDPEAYAYAYKKNPENVKRIWIRVVKGVDPEAEKTLNSEERFQKAFAGIPTSVWKRFEDPRVLHAEAAKAAHEG